ncbi:MAG: TrmH family RNA methyltransferase, partial [Bacteroidales bacterium]|nr:TrmH family RNA methyltransferase [Bacteroidales bacterium]
MSHKLTTDEMHRLTVDEFRSSTKVPLTVVLDNIRSQNNIGSVFRTADAFRIEHIALCGICSTPPHRDIHKTALGAEESVPFAYSNDILSTLDALRQSGYRLCAVEQAHGSLKLGTDSVAAYSPIAIILGNEIEGVQEAVLAHCDAILEIP